MGGNEGRGRVARARDEGAKRTFLVPIFYIPWVATKVKHQQRASRHSRDWIGLRPNEAREECAKDEQSMKHIPAQESYPATQTSTFPPKRARLCDRKTMGFEDGMIW